VSALKERGLWPQAVSLNGATPKGARWPYPMGDQVLYHVRRDLPDGDKRMWWEQQDGTRGLPEGIGYAKLPLYPHDALTGDAAGPVYVVEGEKAADAGRANGMLCVTFAGGAGQKDFGAARLALKGRDVVLLPDNDQPGRDHMRHVALMLTGVAKSVRTLDLPGLPKKGDLYDWFATGRGADELRDLLPAETPTAPKWRKARDLQREGLPPITYPVAGILPEGVTLCAGRPKQGKSFLALNLAIAVAAGGKALGDIPVQQGDVLYLTLEGGAHGFLPRLETMLAGQPAPDALDYATEWPRLEEGGAELLTEWLNEHPQARLVIIDTLARVRQPTNSKLGIYEQDYAAMQSLVNLAASRHVAILVITHTRKAPADDPLDTVSSSTGLTGSVDAVWVLQRVRGQASATLTVTGRAVPDDDLGLEWDEQLCCWTHAGAAEEVKRTHERREVLAVLREEGGRAMTAQQVADVLGRDFVTIRQTMYRMSRSGELLSAGRDGYRLAVQNVAELRTSGRVRPTSNEGSHTSPQSPASQVSQVSPMSDQLSSATDATCDAFTRDGGARDLLVSTEGQPCPNCGVELREGGWCPVCSAGRWGPAP